MLVLSRKVNEEIVIDGGITLKIIEFRPGRVRLGVTAPAGVRVLRKELLVGGAAVNTDSSSAEDLRSNSDGSSA